MIATGMVRQFQNLVPELLGAVGLVSIDLAELQLGMLRLYLTNV